MELMTSLVDDLNLNYQVYRPQNSSATHSFDPGYIKANIIPLVQELGLSKDARILEIGPGPGHLLNLLKQEGFSALEGFDLCLEYRTELEKQGFLSHNVASLTELLSTLEDNSYDLLLAVDVFEHIDRYELGSFLRLVRSKLKKGASVIGQVPNSSGLFGQNTFVADMTHVTPFNEISLESLFKGCGYSQIEIRETRLPRGLANRVRSLVRSVIFKTAYLMIRVCGATPVRNFTHLIVFRASS